MPPLRAGPEQRADDGIPRWSHWRGGFAAGQWLEGGPTRFPSSGVGTSCREPMTGIEPAYLAWEASALPLSYIGAVSCDRTQTTEATCVSFDSCSSPTATSSPRSTPGAWRSTRSTAR
ncbi:hypothetical protein AERO9AM_70289 [Aeromicrobium sp. 9AM]|nr:hypothetical protein AERO9AM_70289 [Aeromicrobium sp. 9AM]